MVFSKALSGGTVGHTGRSMEDSGAESDLKCGTPAQEFSEEKNINTCPKDCSCNILVKNVIAFCLSLKKYA